MMVHGRHRRLTTARRLVGQGHLRSRGPGDTWVTLLVLLGCILGGSVGVAWGAVAAADALIERLANREPPELDFADRTDDHDTSLPFVESGPVPDPPQGWACSQGPFGSWTCEQPAPPPLVEHHARGTVPRSLPRECEADEGCPESSPHCSEDGRCVECSNSSQCPGSTNICEEHLCTEGPNGERPPPPDDAEPTGMSWSWSSAGPVISVGP